MTVEHSVAAPGVPPITAVGAPRPGAAGRLLRNPLGVGSLLVLTVIALAGLLSHVLAPHSPGLTVLAETNARPFTGRFVLGGDQAGRDVLSRLMYGTLGTIEACVVVLVVSVALGATTGLVAGYYRGWFESLTSWVANTIMALPGFVLLIALYTIIGPSILVSMAVFGVLIAPSFYRLVRGLVITVREQLYVDAAKVSGLSDTRIIFRHVLRAVRAPIIIQSAFVLAAGIAIQAGLEFLGLGTAGAASWGGMLQQAFNNIYIAPWNVFWPALVITAATLALVLLGNALRDALDVGSAAARPAPAALVRSAQARRRDQRPVQRVDARAAHASGAGSLLRVRDLVVAYPSPGRATGLTEVVTGVDLDVRAGQVHGLVGESGSGKSQTAFALLGLLPRQAVVLDGSATFDGSADLLDARTVASLRGRGIGYVPQEPMSNLDPTFTVGQQLVLGLRAVRSVTARQARSDLLDLLERVGIADPRRTFDAYPHQISGGMAQRVLIAGAVAPDPRLIIADEPTTALDVTVQAGVLDLLRELQAERGLGMVLVTHNFGVVADICDTVSVMQAGRIVESAPVDDVFASPQHPYTRTLLASVLDRSRLRDALDAQGSRR